MMEDGPLVTIGIATFNAADRLNRAVESALAQTWRPIEIIIVDDCSSDETQSVLGKLDSNHPEIRIFYQDENGGVARTRNRILDEAEGEFIAFFDDDDQSRPDRVARQIERIISYERDYAGDAPVICHTARRQYFPDGTVQIIPAMGTTEGRPAPSGWKVAERVLIGTPLEDGYGACATCSQMARTSVYRDVGGFDPDFRRSEDSDLAVRVARAGGHFVGIDRPLVDQAMIHTADKSLIGEKEFMVKLLEKHRDVPDRLGLYRFCRGWIDVKQAWLEGRHSVFALLAFLLVVRYPAQAIRRFMLAAPNRKLNAAIGRYYEQERRAK